MAMDETFTADDLAAETGRNVVSIDPPRVESISLVDLLRREVAERENVVSPWLPKQGIAMIYAGRGVGKTHVSLELAYIAAATGEMFGRWRAKQNWRVCYLDGEMPLRALQERMEAIVEASATQPIQDDALRFVTPDIQDLGMPDLGTALGQKAINTAIGDDTDLIIVDNISTLAGGIKENEADSWLPLQQWALNHRAKGRTVLFVHHAGKGGQQRGSSRKEDVLDTVIALRRPQEYNPADGAVFEVHFEKARGFHGSDADPFECRLTEENGKRAWATRSVEDSTTEKVRQMLADGMSQKDIAIELGLKKSTISYHAKKPAKADTGESK